jgi:hypothetical protein
MKSVVWGIWIGGASDPKKNFAHNQGELRMEEFIHQQKLALFKKLSRSRTQTRRKKYL